MYEMYAHLALNNFEGAKALREAMNGPTRLKEALFDRKSHGGLTPKELLRHEIGRIQNGLIASFFHPNTAGAQRYADMALERYDSHRRVIASIPRIRIGGVETHPRAGSESVDALLTRFGLRSSSPVRADVGHLFVDTLRVTVKTSETSDKQLGSDVYIVLTVKTPEGSTTNKAWQLNFQYYQYEVLNSTTPRKFYPHFEPGQTNTFFIDTGGGVKLEDVIGSRLVLSENPFNLSGSVWRPERVALEINGVPVVDRAFQDIRVHATASVDLQYPAPAASTPPVFTSTAMLRITSASPPDAVAGALSR